MTYDRGKAVYIRFLFCLGRIFIRGIGVILMLMLYNCKEGVWILGISLGFRDR